MLNVEQALDEVGSKIHTLSETLTHLKPEIDKSQHDIEIAKAAISELHAGSSHLDQLIHAIEEVGKNFQTETKTLTDDFAQLESHLQAVSAAFKAAAQTLEQELAQAATELRDKVAQLKSDTDARLAAVQQLETQWEAFKQEATQHETQIEAKTTELVTAFDHLQQEADKGIHVAEDALHRFDATIATHVHELGNSFHDLIQAGQHELQQLESNLHDLEGTVTHQVEYAYLDSALASIAHEGQVLLQLIGDTPAAIQAAVDPINKVVHDAAHIVDKIHAISDLVKSTMQLAESSL